MEPLYNLLIKSTSRYIPLLILKKLISNCSTCKRRRIKYNKKKPSYKSLLSYLIFNLSLIANIK
jgi:hypothetical protein